MLTIFIGWTMSDEVVNGLISTQLQKDLLRILRMMVERDSLTATLTSVAHSVESLNPGWLCSVLLYNSSTRTLHVGAAPSLPAEFVRLADGVKVGPTVGTCGVAAHTLETVITPTISRDPNWSEIPDAFERFGLRSCFSTPIITKSRELLGTFAVYTGNSFTPSGEQVQLVEQYASVVQLAIQRNTAHEDKNLLTQRLRSISSALPIMLYEMHRSPEGHIAYSYVSEGAYDILGVSPSEVERNPSEFLRLISPESQVIVEREMERSANLLTPARFEYDVLRPDGVRCCLQSMVVPVMMADGCISWSGVAVDITERKEREEKLRRYASDNALKSELLSAARDDSERANRFKSEFLANMSHEIRTPMNGIIASAELLLETELESEQQEFVSIINTCGRALLELVNDVLDLSKIEAGQFELRPSPFSLKGLVSKIVQSLALKASKCELIFDWEILAEVDDYRIGDHARLGQILLNLLSNAIKFTPAGGTVTLVVSNARAPLAPSSPASSTGTVDADTLLFTVTDSGVGIHAEKLDSVFEPFIQIEQSSSTQPQGTGLGLSISQQLAVKMGGRISARPNAGSGTTFELSIPLPATSPGVVVERDSGAAYSAATNKLLLPSRDRLRVLVVDDLAVNCRVLEKLLKNLGITTISATTAESAIALVESSTTTDPIDLVLMDCRMPGTDGLEATRQIRSRTHTKGKPRIVAVTASTAPEDRDRCKAAGMDDFLAKPITRQKVVSILERLFA